MDLKIFFKPRDQATSPEKENLDRNSIDSKHAKGILNSSTELRSTKSLQDRCIPVASTGFPNLFFSDNLRDQQELITHLESAFTLILPKIRVPYFTEDNQLEFRGFFAKIENIIRECDPQSKVYLGGASIRSILSFIYKEMLDANMQDLNPVRFLQDLESGKRKFTVENESGELSPMHVLGIQSDVDMYIEFSEGCQRKDEAIDKAKSFINQGLQKIPNHPLKNLVFPPAAVKSYEEQIQRDSHNGGSALDWVVFPLTSNSGTHFKTPKKCPDILESICKGKLPYYRATNAEIPAVTTLQAYHSLFELPFLELEESEPNCFVQDLKNALQSLKNEDIRERTKVVFQKIVGNTRFPDRVNLELQKNTGTSDEKEKLLQEISLSCSSKGRFPALPELLPTKASTTNIDVELLDKFTKANVFMPFETFINQHTNQGEIYHGTPDLRNIPSILRGNFIVSNRNQGSAVFGRGFYTTKDHLRARCYGEVLSFRINKNNLKIVSFKDIPKNILKQLLLKAKIKDVDVNEYLATYLGVDIIVDLEILIQNSRVLSLNKPQEAFLLDMVLLDSRNSMKYFKKLQKWAVSNLKMFLKK